MRPDGSIDSANQPIWQNRHQPRDFGMYKALVTLVFYTDDPENITKKEDSPEILYEVMIIGGQRDGQLFRNVRNKVKYGSKDNYSERIWKPVQTLTFQDPAAITSVETLNQLNGESVYIQFLNGDPLYPIIIGAAKHALNTNPGSAKSEGIRDFDRFNGINKLIDKDGVYTWTKDLGLFNPLLNEWQAIPGSEAAVNLSITNELLTKFEYNTGLALQIDGLADTFSLAMAVGTSFLMDGKQDLISLTAKFGDTLSVSAAGGIQASTPSGTSLSMKNGEVLIKSLVATLKLGKDGKIGFGNAGVELIDWLSRLSDSLAKATYSGFGAPGSNVAELALLKAELDIALKGGI